MTDPLLVLVTGTGRSGTSTIAGALHHAGLHVPGPHLGADATNPKGFFESRWSVEWHRETTRAARVNDVDGRPDAADRAAAALTAERRERLLAFLRQAREAAGETAGPAAGQVVVKDPRTVWLQQAWREASAAAGLRLGWVTMLRHPAEVVGSRATHYAGRASGVAGDPASYATTNLARWVNGALTSEHGTRGDPRALVRYDDLLADWRGVLDGLAATLGLRYDPGTGVSPHPNDEFVEPALRRHAPSWDGLAVPAALRDLAEGVWRALLAEAAAGAGGQASRAGDPDARAALDAARAGYGALHAQAAALAHDAVTDGAPDGRARAGRRRGATSGPGGRPASPASPALPLERRPVAEVGARDLLGVVRRRATRRLRRQ